jgi:tetratricopeptide (TPR) repeat protein
MNRKLKPLYLCVLLFSYIIPLSAEQLPDSFYLFRDAVYAQNTGTVQIMRFYTAAKQDIENVFSGSDLYRAFSRCAYLMGVSFQTEGKKSEAAACYEQGIAWAEDSIAMCPTSEGYQYLAANIALSCWVKPLSYAMANVAKIEENAQRALDLDPQNLAARYVIAGKYIQAPWPVGNLRKGANILEEIVGQNIGSLEQEDIFNIYLAMAIVCQKEKKNEEAGIWQNRALALYPTNRFMETLFNI